MVQARQHCPWRGGQVHRPGQQNDDPRRRPEAAESHLRQSQRHPITIGQLVTFAWIRTGVSMILKNVKKRRRRLVLRRSRKRYVDMIPIAAILTARRRHGLLVWGISACDRSAKQALKSCDK